MPIIREKDGRHYYFYAHLKHARIKAYMAVIGAVMLILLTAAATVIGEYYLKIDPLLSLPFAVAALLLLLSSLAMLQEMDAMIKTYTILKQAKKEFEERFK